MKRLLIVLVTICLCPLAVAFAGDLVPPGPPGPTMKTLDEVEARIPISSIPYTISQPGSYYLTKNLGPAAQDTDGITVTASNVTIDLNGYCLIGAGKAAGTTGNGIVSSGSPVNITVGNGTIRDWRICGLTLAGATSGRIEGLRCLDNGANGMLSGTSFSIEGNICRGNTDDGVQSGARCTIIGNMCEGNGRDGISAGLGCAITNNLAIENSANGIGAMGYSRIVENLCWGNNTGIYASGSASCIESNQAVTNTAYGIRVAAMNNYIASNRARGNTTANYLIVAGNTEGAGDLANVSF
jgi:parallel beta-helix repeat protein